MKLRILIIVVISLVSLSSISIPPHKIEIQDFKSRIKAKLDSLYDEETDFGGATIGIALPDGRQYGFAVGYSDMENKIKMNPDHRMLGGSSGKIFVSAAIMQLVESGKLKLDDKIEKYLGDLDWFDRIQNHDQITIRNLMQHSTGISRYVFDPDFQKEVHLDADRIWNPKDLLNYVFDKEPEFAAGEDFAYSDTNYILLAMILELVSKTTMYDFVENNILNPFNLDRISPQVDRKIPGIAIGYNKEDDPFYPGKVVENETYKYNVQFEWAGGGFVMNTVDLAQAGKLIYENKVFSQTLMGDFLQGIEAKGLGGKWGLGVHIKETPVGMSYGHSGFFPGYLTNMLYYPEYQFAIAFQVNTTNAKNLSLFRKLFQLIPTIKDYVIQSREESPFDHPETLVRHLYNQVTFPAGNTPDWDHIRTLFIKEATVVMRMSKTETATLSLDGWILDFVNFIHNSKVESTGFEEKIIKMKTMVFGDIAHILVLYTSYIPGVSKAPREGVDSFHMIKKNGKWQIVSILNEIPTPERPKPAVFRG